MGKRPYDFQKLHGLGNDFIVLNRPFVPTDLELSPRLCDRHFGVGADGVLFLETGVDDAYDARLIIINQDGTRPQMCGNGVRCVARYLVETLNYPTTLRILTDAGIRTCQVDPVEWTVAVDMGIARSDGVSEFSDMDWDVVNMGNPHALRFFAEMPTLERIDALGEAANLNKKVFPEGINLEFVVLEHDSLKVVVYERGVGRTMACGTGACAVAVGAWQSGRIPEGPVNVRLPGGTLRIEDRDGIIWMTGGATLVYQGALSSELRGSQDTEV